MSEKCLLFGTCLVMPGELLWRLKILGQSVKRIEETLTMKKMKNDERRDEDEEDERGSCTLWVGVRLRPSCLVCRGLKPGGLTIPGAWSCCSLFIFVGRSPIRGAFRLGEREVQADDSKRWVSEVLGRVHAAGLLCCLV